MKALYKRLKKNHPMGEFVQQRKDLVFISIEPDQLRPILTDLRDNEGFSHLVLLTAVDWLEDNLFQLTYLICNRKNSIDLGLRVMLDREHPSMESIHDLWPTAATYQRELREMFGIDFPGSPGLEKDFILEGWNDIPPYRRDFDTLKFAEDNFRDRPGRETNDPAEYMKQQLYPDGGS